MEILSLLEQKVVLLIGFVEKLEKNHETLKVSCEVLEKEIIELKAENAHFVEENEQLTTRINSLLCASEAENRELNELSQEKKYTKQVVDDLINSIKNIEFLVEKEMQP